MELKIEKYVSEVHSELSEFIEKNNKTLIESPTESGKSYFVKEFIKNNPDKHIVFAVPTRILVDNLGNEGAIKSGYGESFLNQIEEKESIITTYDSLDSGIYKRNRPDIVFIDEAHLLAGHGDFRRIIQTILTLKSKVVLISGTPEIIELLEGYKKVTIESKSRAYRQCNIYEVEDQPYTTAKNIINKPKDDVLKIIRLNSKDKILSLYEEYYKTKKCAIYYSTNKENGYTINELIEIQGSELTKKIKVGIIPKEIEVLFTTSIIDSGLTLTVFKEVDIHVISNNIKKLPNAIDVCQIAYRVRTNQGVSNLNIYGGFGKLKTEKSLPKTNNLKNLISYMAICYDNYRELEEDIYQGILSNYDIHTHIIRLKKTPTLSQSRISDYEIANNLDSYPELYLLLKNKCSKKNIEKLKRTHNINGKGKARAISILNLLLDADLNHLSFNIFLKSKTFYKTKLKALISVKKIYRDNEKFAYLIDKVIECYLDESKDDFKIENTLYNEIIKNEQSIFREFVNTLFKADRFDRENLTIHKLKSSDTKEYVLDLLERINQYKFYNKAV